MISKAMTTKRKSRPDIKIEPTIKKRKCKIQKKKKKQKKNKGKIIFKTLF